VNFERLLAAGLPELAGERLKRSSEAEAFVRRNCLKASVVPVMNPSTDIASSYVGAKTNVAMLTAEITQDEKEGFATDRRAGLRAQLEAFIQSHCD
jgi:hypothetical protein